MARRGRGKGDESRKKPGRTARTSSGEALNAPFVELGRKLRDATAKRPAPPPQRESASSGTAPRSPSAAQEVEPREANLFESAMQGVVPLAGRDRAGHDRPIDDPPPRLTPRPSISEEAEALAALSDLVTGAARFDVTDTHEYFEGIVVGLDRRLVRRLRNGEFASQAHIDLHGLTSVAARAAVDRFLDGSIAAGHRCVLIVHGRGRNSKDGTPVLKEGLKSWLTRGHAARRVLAFATARPCDGGAGALYVLLRRDGRRRRFHLNEGSRDL
ncbi:MAG TPA: Smr/MutS family protein [Candidatus Bathyarchaeia archaeon]|nr:Smr/MutS family protein [Candidatus Bathyarchaeia archaeon]